MSEKLYCLRIRKIYQKILPIKFRIRFNLMRRNSRRKIVSTYVNLIDKNVSTLSQRLESLNGAFKYQRCFIMGNGPSLNKMNLDHLKNDYVWGSNRCYLLFDKIQWRPKFYVAVDKRVVPDNANEINKLCKKMPESHFFYPVEFRFERILQSAKNVYWYKEIPMSEDNIPYSMFSTNPSVFVYSVRTVTIAMLQLAVYLGFNPIYLIGCDTSYTIPKTVLYENGNSDSLISTENDPNHFDPSYFGIDKKWNDPHVDRMIFHFEQAKRICEEQRIQVINATIGGNLNVFPRVNYMELF